jgi:glycine cleavage system H protein
MLGEIVEVRFEKMMGDAVAGGEIVGSIEGFKAISDIYSCAEGSLAATNSALVNNVEIVSEEPYGNGWLYEIDGTPDAKCMSMERYRELLDATIDRILEKQQAEENL